MTLLDRFSGTAFFASKLGLQELVPELKADGGCRKRRLSFESWYGFSCARISRS